MVLRGYEAALVQLAHAVNQCLVMMAPLLFQERLELLLLLEGMSLNSSSE